MWMGLEDRGEVLRKGGGYLFIRFSPGIIRLAEGVDLVVMGEEPLGSRP